MNVEDSDELLRNKKYQRFQADFGKVLTSIERTSLSDWASLSNGLAQVLKTLESSSNAEFKTFPEKLLFCRVLGRCLDPQGTMGVHKKAVEVLHKVCSKLGPEGMGGILPILSSSVFQLLPCAAMQARPDILNLIDSQFVPLPLHSLLLCLPGLLGAVLPSLEESDTTELYRRGFQIVSRVQQRLEKEENGQHNHVFFHAVWCAVRNAPGLRVSALSFLRQLLVKSPGFGKGPPKEGPTRSELAMPSLAGGDFPLVLRALFVALHDRNEKCLRLVLDTLIYHFPLHEEGVFSVEEKVELVCAALRLLVTNPQNATLRRVFMWLYNGNEVDPAYYQEVSKAYLIQALTVMFTAVGGGQSFMYPHAFESLLALLCRPEGEEHFQDLIPEVVGGLCTALQTSYVSGEWHASTSSTQRIFKLLDAIPWKWFLHYVTDSVDELTAFLFPESPLLALRPRKQSLLTATATYATPQLKNDSVMFDPLGHLDLEGVRRVFQRTLTIIESTRLHYIAKPATAEDVEAVVGVCTAVCGAIEAISNSSSLTSNDADVVRVKEIIRLALDVFHISYFGVARGLCSASGFMVRAPDVITSSAAATDSDGTASSGAPLPSSSTAMNCTASIESVFHALSAAFVALTKAHTDRVVPLEEGTADISLLAEISDTLFSVMTHVRREVVQPKCFNQSSPPAWLVTALSIIFHPGQYQGLAVCASQLVLDSLLMDAGDLPCGYLQSQWAEGVPQRIIERLWPLFSIQHSPYHTQLAKLFVKAYRHADLRAGIDRVMAAPTLENAMRYHVLFRVVCDLNLTEHVFHAGLQMMLSLLASTDGRLRLIAAGFVEQTPAVYLYRIIEPLLIALVQSAPDPSQIQAEGGSLRSYLPPAEALSYFLETLHNLLHSHGRNAMLQRLWTLALPACFKSVVDIFEAKVSRFQHEDCLATADKDMPLQSLQSLLMFVLIRIARLETHSEVEKLSKAGELRSANLSSLRTGVPSSTIIVVKNETSTMLQSLEILNAMLRLSVNMPDPPDALNSICTHTSQLAVNLLLHATEGRMAATQILLLETLQLSVAFLDAQVQRYSKKSTRPTDATDNSSSSTGQGTSYADAADMNSLGVSPPLSRGGLSRPKRGTIVEGMAAAGQSSTATGGGLLAVLQGSEFTQLISLGIAGAAVSELHPLLSCFNLLSYWRTAVTSLLPFLHESLSSVGGELCEVYCDVVRALHEQPLSAATGGIIQQCFQGVSEYVEFLFRPSTRQMEGVTAPTESRKLESVVQLPMWLLQQGLQMQGGASNNSNNNNNAGSNVDLSNLDLALRRLDGQLEAMVAVGVDTYLHHRQQSRIQSESCTRNRETQAALSNVRHLCDQTIRNAFETFLRCVELEFYDRLAMIWAKRHGSSLTLQAWQHCFYINEKSDEAAVMDFLSLSVGVTPVSIMSAVDQLLQRWRRSNPRSSAPNTKGSGALTYDAAILYLLAGFVSRCKSAERLDKTFSIALDLLTTHASSSSTPSWVAVPLSLRIVEILHVRRTEAVPAGSATSSGDPVVSIVKDRRTVALLCRSFELLANGASSLGEAEDSYLIAFAAFSQVTSTLSALMFARDTPSDKVAETGYLLYSKVIGPSIAMSINPKTGGYDRVLQLAPRTLLALQMLHSLIGFGEPVVRKFKGDVIELLFSSNFFKMSRSCVSKWRQVFERLSADRTIHVVLMQKLGNATNTPSVLTAIVQSADDEAPARGRQLKRLAFYVFCMPTIDRDFLVSVRDRLADTIRLFSKRQGRMVAVRYALFVFRVLMTKVPSPLLSSFWPLIMPEVMRVLSTRPTGDDDIYLAMEALKVIDFAMTILPNDFQYFRWVFLDDGGVVDSVTAALRRFTSFIPLVRAQHEVVPESVPLSLVRRESMAPTGNTLTTLARPILAFPERCYFDLRGIDAVSAAMSLIATTTNRKAVEDPEGSLHVCRQSDAYDEAYVAWLLEAEFMHVGVAASERQRTLTTMSPPLAPTQSPTSLPGAPNGQDSSAPDFIEIGSTATTMTTFRDGA